MDDLTGWTEALGRGDVTVTLSLDSVAQVNGGFNFDTGRVILNSGYEMPINGLGTYSLHGETCINSVKAALSSGVLTTAPFSRSRPKAAKTWTRYGSLF